MGDWWRKGLRVALVGFAVAALGVVGGCSSDDDDKNPYDFNGTWLMTSVIVQSNLPGFPVGLAGVDEVKVSQSGTSIAVGIAGVPLQTGTCDPNAGTFSVTATDPPLVITTTGTAVDENTATGEWTMIGGPYVVRATYTAELVSRALAAGGQPGKSGFAAGILQHLK